MVGGYSPRNPQSCIAEPLEPRRLLAAVLLKDLDTDEQGSHPFAFVKLGDKVVFPGWTASSFTSGYTQLWKTDGTEAGTTLIKDGLASVESLTASRDLV